MVSMRLSKEKVSYKGKCQHLHKLYQGQCSSGSNCFWLNNGACFGQTPYQGPKETFNSQLLTKKPLSAKVCWVSTMSHKAGAFETLFNFTPGSGKKIKSIQCSCLSVIYQLRYIQCLKFALLVLYCAYMACWKKIWKWWVFWEPVKILHVKRCGFLS